MEIIKKLLKNKIFKRSLSYFLVTIIISQIVFTSQCYASSDLPLFLINGTLVHSAVINKFRVENSYMGDVSNCGKKIPDPDLTTLFGFLKPDMVIDYYNNDNTDIYELKPISYCFTPVLHGYAVAQLNGYVVAYKKGYPLKNPSKGTLWNPNGRVIQVPAAKKAVMLATAYTVDPGLIYYKYVDTDTAPDPALSIVPYSIPANDGETYNVFAKDPKSNLVLAYALIGGAVVVVIGTIIEDVLTLGAGTLDDAVCIAAAAILIQRGMEYLPVSDPPDA